MEKKKISILVLSTLFAYSVSYAATSGRDLDQEIDQLTAQRAAQQAASGQTAGSPAGAGAAIAPQGDVRGQPIYILNQATPTSNAQVSTAAQVQRQAQVDVTAAPLQKSRAEQIREARQQAEINTENSIVEKLEVSRIEDEKRRAQQILGNTNPVVIQNVNQNTAAAAAVVAPAVVAPVVVAPAPVPPPPVVVAPVAPIAVIVHEREDEPEEKPHRDPKYFSGNIGVSQYPDVRNVRGNYSLGAALGIKVSDAYAVEGSFTYGNYTLDTRAPGYYDYTSGTYIPASMDVDQYAFGIATKWFFSDSLIRPYVGGAAQYSYRTYKWSQSNYCSYCSGSNSNTANSSAVDLGFLVGTDFQLTKNFSLGLDFRYFFNFINRVNASNGSALNTSYVDNLEKFQYYNLGLVGSYYF